ncbi:hypothetical protein [Novosphingobium naphthalenivorans]|uniref:hypothetical protein n=1 Tax=Novosphingobium naphthalenivorans TaxID=273168 RepID=UPI0012EEC01C|nr:hypothetical protein [Novosphingobium naphthalenivorans]
MTSEQISEAIKKLRYQVNILGQTIDYDRYPVESLIMSMDWGNEDLNKAHDIFERWDNKLESGETISSAQFENDFSSELGVSYQGLKSIILAFYKNGQWTNVCEAYVDSFGNTPAMEYHSIMRRAR